MVGFEDARETITGIEKESALIAVARYTRATICSTEKHPKPTVEGSDHCHFCKGRNCEACDEHQKRCDCLQVSELQRVPVKAPSIASPSILWLRLDGGLFHAAADLEDVGEGICGNRQLNLLFIIAI